MQKKNEHLKNEDVEVHAKLKMYLEKFKELESTVSTQQKEAVKNRVVDASLIQKMVQLNTKAFAADGDLQEKQLSPPRPPLVDSTTNRNANGSDK
ncbi:hypothetical protein H5410_064222 [Solanum commersonii]|uniref:Uncharacterized protein n=1 Tax=Solanum commersonii TaxID=4109 RepID=A0A9J5W052_SOLCO|nr:hypothetical protein H5410_064222 [Solanum commersonii]